MLQGTATTLPCHRTPWLHPTGSRTLQHLHHSRKTVIFLTFHNPGTDRFSRQRIFDKKGIAVHMADALSIISQIIYLQCDYLILS